MAKRTALNCNCQNLSTSLDKFRAIICHEREAISMDSIMRFICRAICGLPITIYKGINNYCIPWILSIALILFLVVLGSTVFPLVLFAYLLWESYKTIIEWGTEKRYEAEEINVGPNERRSVSSFRVLPERCRPPEKREKIYPKCYVWLEPFCKWN